MSEMRDVVLVTIDSLRADRCGFLGHDTGLTPAMDRLADNGLVFENAIAPAGATSGSTGSFFTGAYPIDRPTADDQRDVFRQHLSSAVTLPETFQQMGYRTGAFTANPWTSRFFGYGDGFDDFEDFMDDDATSESIKNKKRRGKVGKLALQLVNWWQGQDMYMSWEAYEDDVMAWVEEARSDDEPFFLWLFLVDVHMPYLPPEGYKSQSSLAAYAANAWLYAGSDPDAPFGERLHDRLLRAYDDTVRFTDEFVGRLGDAVDDETLLCVHADHGEAFGERDHYGHGYLYEEEIHVPLFVANATPNRIRNPTSLRELRWLLPSLARGETVTEDDIGPVTTSRNRAGWRVVRGVDWRYTRTPDDEWLEDCDGTPLENEGLLELGRRIADQRAEADEERRRIIGAAASVAEEV